MARAFFAELKPLYASSAWITKTSSKRIFESYIWNSSKQRIHGKSLLTISSDLEKVETAELNKTITKKQLRGLRRHRTETIQEVIKQGKGFKMARKKLSGGKLQFTGVLEEDSSLTIDRDRIVDRGPKIHENLYSNRPDPEPPYPEMQHGLADFPKVEPWEVKLAVKQSK